MFIDFMNGKCVLCELTVNLVSNSEWSHFSYSGRTFIYIAHQLLDLVVLEDKRGEGEIKDHKITNGSRITCTILCCFPSPSPSLLFIQVV